MKVRTSEQVRDGEMRTKDETRDADDCMHHVVPFLPSCVRVRVWERLLPLPMISGNRHQQEIRKKRGDLIFSVFSSQYSGLTQTLLLNLERP